MENRSIHDDVWLAPWDPEWAREFHMEKQCIVGSMMAEEHSAFVRHIGSTAIEGMPAKPIIDILVCPDREVSLEDCIPDLERIGYRNLGECGRPGRYFLSSGEEPGKTFYLHLCYEDNPVAQDQLLFLEIMKESESLRAKYRYTKHPNGCAGPSSYSAELINDAVLKEIRRFLTVIRAIPQEDLLDKAREKHDGVNEVAYRQAEQDYFEAHKQITALEEQVIKALTGENSLDISIVNSMMPKYKEKMEQAQRRMEDAKAKMDQEKEQSKEVRREIGELDSWADAFDDAEPKTRRMIIARLVERIDIGADYSISVSASSRHGSPTIHAQ